MNDVLLVEHDKQLLIILQQFKNFCLWNKHFTLFKARRNARPHVYRNARIASAMLALQAQCSHCKRNARIVSAVLAIAIPSVCPSVCHTLVLCQNDGT